MKKNSCTLINPKKYSCYGLKKNSCKEFDNEKNFRRLENSPHPYKFSNGPSLIPRENALAYTQTTKVTIAQS